MKVIETVKEKLDLVDIFVGLDKVAIGAGVVAGTLVVYGVGRHHGKKKVLKNIKKVTGIDILKINRKSMVVSFPVKV